MKVKCNNCDWNSFEDDLVDKNGKTARDDDCEFDKALFCPECGYRVLEMLSKMPKDAIEAFDMTLNPIQISKTT